MMNNPLKVSQKAPKFKANDVFGNKVSMDDFTDKHVLLVFLRYSGCPWCNLTIHRLTLEYEQLKKDGCQVIAFVQSERDNVIKNIYDRHKPRPQFPIIPDQDMKFYRQYSVNPTVKDALRNLINIPYWLEATRKYGFKQTKIDGSMLLVPAWFLVDTQTGKIVKNEYNASFYDHESFIKVYDSLTFGD